MSTPTESSSSSTSSSSSSSSSSGVDFIERHIEETDTHIVFDIDTPPAPGTVRVAFHPANPNWTDEQKAAHVNLNDLPAFMEASARIDPPLPVPLPVNSVEELIADFRLLYKHGDPLDAIVAMYRKANDLTICSVNTVLRSIIDWEVKNMVKANMEAQAKVFMNEAKASGTYYAIPDQVQKKIVESIQNEIKQSKAGEEILIKKAVQEENRTLIVQVFDLATRLDFLQTENMELKTKINKGLDLTSQDVIKSVEIQNKLANRIVSIENAVKIAQKGVDTVNGRVSTMSINNTERGAELHSYIDTLRVDVDRSMKLEEKISDLSKSTINIQEIPTLTARVYGLEEKNMTSGALFEAFNARVYNVEEKISDLSKCKSTINGQAFCILNAKVDKLEEKVDNFMNVAELRYNAVNSNTELNCCANRELIDKLELKVDKSFETLTSNSRENVAKMTTSLSDLLVPAAVAEATKTLSLVFQEYRLKTGIHIDSIDQQIDCLSNDLRNTKENLAQNELQLARTTFTLNDQEKVLDRKETRIATVTASIEDLQSRVERLEGDTRVLSLSEKVTTFGASLAHNEARITVLEKDGPARIDMMMDMLAVANTSLNKTSEKLEKIDIRLDATLDSIRDMSKSTGVCDRLDEATKSITQIKASMSSCVFLSIDADKKAKADEERITILETELKKLIDESDLPELEAPIQTEIIARLGQVEWDHKTLNNRTVQLREHCDQLIDKHDRHADLLDALERKTNGSSDAQSSFCAQEEIEKLEVRVNKWALATNEVRDSHNKIEEAKVKALGELNAKILRVRDDTNSNSVDLNNVKAKMTEMATLGKNTFDQLAAMATTLPNRVNDLVLAYISRQKDKVDRLDTYVYSTMQTSLTEIIDRLNTLRQSFALNIVDWNERHDSVIRMIGDLDSSIKRNREIGEQQLEKSASDAGRLLRESLEVVQTKLHKGLDHILEDMNSKFKKQDDEIEMLQGWIQGVQEQEEEEKIDDNPRHWINGRLHVGRLDEASSSSSSLLDPVLAAKFAPNDEEIKKLLDEINADPTLRVIDSGTIGSIAQIEESDAVQGHVVQP